MNLRFECLRNTKKSPSLFLSVSEDGSIAMSAETNGYVPEVYPWVIQDRGEAFVSIGRLEDAYLDGEWVPDNI